MLRDDYAAAEKALSNPGLKSLLGIESVLNEPVALHRARLAFLRGRTDEAKNFAEQAITSIHESQLVPRQEPFALMQIAEAEAFAGMAAEAERDAEAAVAQAEGHDAFDAMELQPELGRIYVAVGDREKAIGKLRSLMSGPCGVAPIVIRFDPIWSRLKDDPRFEELLKSAKPL